MKVMCTVERDNDRTGCFMVVLKKQNDKAWELIGIPMRGVDHRTALSARDNLFYAFQYGFRTALESMEHHIWRTHVTRESKEDAEA